ncbi:hypothetical protein M758_1G163700 [Ceratodon purpureus]|nr:hypothetical protein M758_1G163700 [Ceratodon purpureus]
MDWSRMLPGSACRVHLQALNLSFNVFRGAIPSFWGNSASLRILDLSNNRLSDEIPKELNQLLSLSFLDLSNNDLDGALPQGGILASFNASSFEGNDRLCGHPTRRTCDLSTRSLLESSTIPPGVKVEVMNGDDGKPLSTGMIVAICISAFAVSKGVLFFIWCWRRKKMRSDCEVKLAGGRMIMFQLTGQVTPLAKAVLRKAVKLKPRDIIGSGGYGTVYKLVLDDMSTFAVKKLTKGAMERDTGFERELQTLADVRHRNLCTLRGYYSAPQINLLVYDLMPNGNLESALHDFANGNTGPLNWELRLKIALGVARGLSYLHYDCIPHIIHRDIKCSNILLDEHMEAHVADFGLAKFINPNETHVTTIAAGTLGYLPPEYLDTGKITEKGDVYSFGVVLLELLTGKRPNDDSFRDHDFSVVQWANALLAENHPEDIFDEIILGATSDEDLLTTLSIAMHCTNGVPKERPNMQHVVKMLQKLCGEDDGILSRRTSISNQTQTQTRAQTQSLNHAQTHAQTQTQSHAQTHAQTSMKVSLETGMVYPCDDAV